MAQPGFILLGRHLADAFFGRLAEWAAALMLLAAGWALLRNTDLFAGATGTTYRNLAEIFPQQTWATVVLILGGLRMAVLLVNGAWRRSPHARAFMAVLSQFFWINVAIAAAPAFGLLFAFVLPVVGMDFANLYRAMGDAGAVDDASRGAGNGTR